MSDEAPAVVVIVDDDTALLSLLSQLLTAPGRTVDTVSGDYGLTAELLVLSAPNVVLLNPHACKLTLEQMRELIKEVRDACRTRFVLMLPDDESELVKSLLADGALPVKTLLRDPLATLARAVGVKSLGPAQTPQAPAPSPSRVRIDQLGADDILDLELTAEVAPVVPPVKPVIAQLNSAAAAPAADLAQLIAEELTTQAEEPDRIEHFEIYLDTVSEHNLYRTATDNMTGVFVTTSVHPKVGSPVVLTISFPWNQTVKFNGVVGFQRNNLPFGKRLRSGIGAELKGLSEADREVLLRFQVLRAPIVVPT